MYIYIYIFLIKKIRICSTIFDPRWHHMLEFLLVLVYFSSFRAQIAIWEALIYLLTNGQVISPKLMSFLDHTRSVKHVVNNTCDQIYVFGFI